LNTVTLTEDAIKLIAEDAVVHYIRYSEEHGSLDSKNRTFLLELVQHYVLGESDISGLVDRVFDEATKILGKIDGD
jgi:hypothetical protein